MKKSFILIACILIAVLVGCNKVYIESEDIVNFAIVQNKVEQYLYRIQKNDLMGANELVSKELESKEKLDTDSLPILAFDYDSSIELKKGVLAKVYVVRGKKDKPFCCLDKWYITVERDEKEGYQITKVKSLVDKEYFVEGNSLKVLDSGEAQNNVVLNLEDLPKEIYVKNQKALINDSNIPLDKFGELGMSFDGNTVGFTTTNGNDSFIGVALLENVRAVFAPIGMAGSSGTSDITESDLKKDFGKPIAKKVEYIDLLKNSQIEKLLFSEETDALVVQYKDKDNTSKVNIYTLPDGDMLPLRLDEVFPDTKYVVECVGSVKAEILLYVSKRENVNGIHQELLGEYIVNLKEKTIDKI